LVLIEPTEAPSQIGSIIVPSNVHITLPSEGTVVAVGPELMTTDENGRKIPKPGSIQVGMFVMHHLYSGTKIKINGKEYLLIEEKDIHAIIRTKIVPDTPVEEIVPDKELVEAG